MTSPNNWFSVSITMRKRLGQVRTTSQSFGGGFQFLDHLIVQHATAGMLL